MKQGSLVFTLLCSLLMTGCGTMNSDFSCKVTAGDSCLTIEQVDAMTRFADGADSHYRARKGTLKQKSSRTSQVTSLSEQELDQPIWVASWKDQFGKVHNAVRLYAGSTSQKTVG